MVKLISRHILFSLAGITLLAGCAHQPSLVMAYEKQFQDDPPTTEWLRENIQTFREKAWTEPTKENVAVYGVFAEELKKRDALETKEQNWYAQTHRLYTLSWGNMGRGGSVYRQPAYIHVLADGQSVAMATPQPNLTPLGTMARPEDMVLQSLNKLNGVQAGKGYSLYELARWERYCAGGGKMDKADWAFVKKEGVQNIPTKLISNCTPPR